MIPEFSEIRTPVMNPKLRRTLKGIDLPAHQLRRTYIPERLEDEGLVKRQSRFEVFWRTVVRNCFNGKYPAPASCGNAILDEMEAIIYAHVIFAAIGSKKQLNDVETEEIMARVADSLEGQDWDTIKTNIAKQYSAVLAFRGSRPYESKELAYPPEFSRVMDDLESAWKREEWFPGALPFWAEIAAKMNQARRISAPQTAVKETIRRYSGENNLIVTDEGHLGTANESASPGDEAWILSGGSVPLVLRVVRDGHYRLISEAYVHGVMHGEAVLDKNSSDATTVVLV
jgi:hypothetical protein